MIKKLFTYIFIYTLLVGCDAQSILTNETSSECVSNCFLDISAPSLQMDDNGYYHIEWLESYNQTFSTLDANIGLDRITKVMWDSDSGINYSGYWVSSVNHASYTDPYGVAHTVLAVWEEQIKDTLTVYAGYNDRCNIEHIDSIKVIVDNEI